MRVVATLLGNLVGLAAAFALPGTGQALDPRLDAGGFRDEDLEVAEEIASYPAEERHAALVAAGHPEDLLAVQQIQTGSADAFADLVDGFPREDQEQIWDLVRYPGLVADLARGGAKSDAELERIAGRYPEEIRDAIRREGRQRYATWVEIYALDLEAEQEFSRVIARHPADVRSAFQRLRGRPDLLSALVENVGVATRIGAAYREDPTRVEARFDTLHQEVLAARDAQRRSWERELEDPEAREELETAARDFAEDQGYDLDEPVHDGAVHTRVVHVDHYVNTNPYPYWFGYPTWYASPYWYPASVWSHVGFRFGGGNGYVAVGLPSPYFLGWYDNFYYGGGYGYGYGNSWGNPYGYYAGYPGYRRFHAARYYDDHRRKTFYGHRRRPDDDGRYGGHASGRSGRRDAQERLMKRPSREVDTRVGERGPTGQDAPRRSERFGRRDGRRTEAGPDVESGGAAGDPRERLQRRNGDSRERQWTSTPGGSRLERRSSPPRGRDAGDPPGTSGVRERRRDGPPDVSSGPPSRLARSNRFEREARSQAFESSRSPNRAGGSARERMRAPGFDSGRGSQAFSSGGDSRARLGRSDPGRSNRSGPLIAPASGGGGGRAHGGPRPAGASFQDRGGRGGHSSSGPAVSPGRSSPGGKSGGHGGGAGGRSGGNGGRSGGGGGRSFGGNR
jgi:hypothetical protein